MKLTNNKILITGGASGIGFALAERFIKENNTVIICGRRQSALAEAVAKYPAIITRQCDLTISSEREDLFKWISEEHNDLNVLVNNAGIQQWMSITDSDFYQRAKEEISINIEAPLHLTSLFKPQITQHYYECHIGVILCSIDKNTSLFSNKSIFSFIYTFIKCFTKIKKY